MPEWKMALKIWEKAKERKLEREALAKAEKQKMEKEQEAVFDAVLQEIFP